MPAKLDQPIDHDSLQTILIDSLRGSLSTVTSLQDSLCSSVKMSICCFSIACVVHHISTCPYNVILVQ